MKDANKGSAIFERIVLVATGIVIVIGGVLLIRDGRDSVMTVVVIGIGVSSVLGGLFLPPRWVEKFTSWF